MNLMTKLSSLAALSVLAFAPLASAQTLTQFGGKVEVSSDGVAKVVKKAPLALKVGDRVSTADGTAVVTFADGSEVRLETQSQATIGSASSTFMLVRITAGKLWAKVAKVADRQFEVRSQNAVASVRGTEFSMTVNGLMSSRTSVQEGRVSVRALSNDRPIGAERLIGAGQSVNVIGKQAGIAETLQGQITAPAKAQESVAANAEVSRLGATPAAIRATFAREASVQLGQDAVQRAAAGASASPQAQESGAALQVVAVRQVGVKGGAGKEGVKGGVDRGETPPIMGPGRMTTIGIEERAPTTLKTVDEKVLDASTGGESLTEIRNSLSSDSKTSFEATCPTCPKLR
jgi:hypothetical protein